MLELNGTFRVSMETRNYVCVLVEVETGHQRLVTPGQSFRGVTVDDSSVSFDGDSSGVRRCVVMVVEPRGSRVSCEGESWLVHARPGLTCVVAQCVRVGDRWVVRPDDRVFESPRAVAGVTDFGHLVWRDDFRVIGGVL